MAHLLWPTRSEQYFLLAERSCRAEIDELDEFNEAPHVLNNVTNNSYNSSGNGSNGRLSVDIDNDNLNHYIDRDDKALIIT